MLLSFAPAIGKPYEGKPHVRFDEGAVETGYGRPSEAPFNRKGRETDRVNLRARRHRSTLQSRNVLNNVRKADQKRVKSDLHRISRAESLKRAQRALGRFCSRWKEIYPKAVRCLLSDEEDLLSFYKIKEPSLWPQIRTTNAIERRFKEVRRRTRPMETFSDRTSMERILYAVFSYENLRQRSSTPFLAVTQNS